MMQPADRSHMVFWVALATLLLTNVAYTSKKILNETMNQKRQLFHENLLPYFGGKIPESAFQADRLALNMLNKEGISVPDGILFEARPKESFHQSPRNDPELSNSILKMIHTPDNRFILEIDVGSVWFIPSEGKYDANSEVETTYKISIPTYMQNYQLPKFRPITETLQLPVRQVFENGLPISNLRGQLGVPFNTIPKKV
ncbi:Chitin-binding type-2 domain-containing protein [Aphis craccivora]|uniref:Chitin-binding type-2 domain-containing protein n=1 Tax=Aphis craccivora TaxID=307492 RepID=A0A6G0ZKB7_APHCR|nr:Chitin-binding type-2 domain-containing protein [Aphis craccivora]